MPIARIVAGGVAVLLLTGPAAYAQKGKGGPSNHGGGPKPTAPTSHGNSNAGGGPKTPHSNPHTTPTSTTPKTHGNPHTTTKPSSTSTTPTASATSTSPQPTPDTSASPSDTTLNPIAQKLQGKPLGARIEKMLPKGMTLDAASAGFKNQGQFIAAVHVSQNLGIPFANLKATMLGTPLPGSTPPPGSTLPGSTLPGSTLPGSGSSATPKSLGQAIKTLRPTADASAEAQRAETQASLDVSGTSPTSPTTTPTATSITTTQSKKSKR